MSPNKISVRGYNRKPGALAPAGMADPDPLTSYNDCKGRQEKGGKEADTDGREGGGKRMRQVGGKEGWLSGEGPLSRVKIKVFHKLATEVKAQGKDAECQLLRQLFPLCCRVNRRPESNHPPHPSS